jgi:hypothetical protein
MKWYWAKITLGAIAVFAVGYASVWFVRGRVHSFRRMVESSDPISIPLAFFPFTVDGARAGTFRGVRIERSSPKRVERVILRVALADSGAPDLATCRLTSATPGNFNPETGFRCLAPEQTDSALVSFGSVTITRKGGPDLTLPLLLDSALVADMRNSDRGVEKATGAFGSGEGTAARAEADRIRIQVKTRTDSIRAEVRRDAKAPPAPPSAPPKPN